MMDLALCDGAELHALHLNARIRPPAHLDHLKPNVLALTVVIRRDEEERALSPKREKIPLNVSVRFSLSVHNVLQGRVKELSR